MRKKEEVKMPLIDYDIVEIESGQIIGLNQFSENLKQCDIKVNIDKNDFDVHTVVLLLNGEDTAKRMDITNAKMVMEFDKCLDANFTKVFLIIQLTPTRETSFVPFISFIDSEYVPHEMCRHTIQMEENSGTTVIELFYKNKEWHVHPVKKARNK